MDSAEGTDIMGHNQDKEIYTCDTPTGSESRMCNICRAKREVDTWPKRKKKNAKVIMPTKQRRKNEKS
jgi:hypothetical protein